MRCIAICTTLLAGLVILAPASGEENEKLPAFLIITVPPDAILEVDGTRVKQTGPVRRVYSPFIEVGKKYQYTLRATFKENDKEVVREKVVTVEPGKEVSVDLSVPLPTAPAPVKVLVAQIPLAQGIKLTSDMVEVRDLRPSEMDDYKKSEKQLCPPDPLAVTGRSPKRDIKAGTLLKTTDFESTPKPAETKKPVESPKPTTTPPAETKKPVEAPKPTTTPPAETKKPVETPKPTITPPAEAKKPVEAPKPTITPPAETKKPVETPKPTTTPPAETKKPVEVVKKPVLPMPRVVEKKPPLASMPTTSAVADAMLKLAKVTERDVLMDVGCGDAIRVIKAAKDTKARKVIGVEFTEERVKLAQENVKKAGVADLIEIRLADPAKLSDVSEASVVLISLFPETSKPLLPALKGTLKSGSRVVAHDFDLGDWKPDREVPVLNEKKEEHKIYIWQLP